MLTDIDGTLAPITSTPAEAEVPEGIRETLAKLSEAYLLVAGVSGREPSEARELVGLRNIAYFGNHGLELLRAFEDDAEVVPAAEPYFERMRELELLAREELAPLGAFVQDKGIAAAVHFRNVPEEVGERCVKFVKEHAERLDLVTGKGRGVIEVKPPVEVDKGTACRRLIEEAGPKRAMFLGDDVSDLDAFRALAAMLDEGTLEQVVRVGVGGPGVPEEVVSESDLVVEGLEGVKKLLQDLIP
nr:trehalose-phosphatase [Rubrobacter radiotolerans]